MLSLTKGGITMATVKLFTDLSQSKTLSKILPLETADMVYTKVNEYHTPFVRIEKVNELDKDDVCAWSLAALLEIIPKHIKGYNVLRIDIGDNDTSIWYYEVGCGVNNDLPGVTKEYTIDACYELILKLHELNLL